MHSPSPSILQLTNYSPLLPSAWLPSANTLTKAPPVVERPREQAEESDAFCFVSGKGAEMAKAMGLAGQVSGRVAASYTRVRAACLMAQARLRRKCFQGRTPRDCIRRLVAKYASSEGVGQVQDPREFAWKRLAEEVHLMKRFAPGVSCLLGPLEAEAKARKVAQRRERTKVGEVEQPETLAAAEEGVKQVWQPSTPAAMVLRFRRCGFIDILLLVCKRSNLPNTMTYICMLGAAVHAGC